MRIITLLLVLWSLPAAAEPLIGYLIYQEKICQATRCIILEGRCVTVPLCTKSEKQIWLTCGHCLRGVLPPTLRIEYQGKKYPARIIDAVHSSRADVALLETAYVAGPEFGYTLAPHYLAGSRATAYLASQSFQPCHGQFAEPKTYGGWVALKGCRFIPGDSGCPVLDQKGRLTGLVSSYESIGPTGIPAPNAEYLLSSFSSFRGLLQHHQISECQHHASPPSTNTSPSLEAQVKALVQALQTVQKENESLRSTQRDLLRKFQELQKAEIKVVFTGKPGQEPLIQKVTLGGEIVIPSISLEIYDDQMNLLSRSVRRLDQPLQLRKPRQQAVNPVENLKNRLDSRP